MKRFFTVCLIVAASVCALAESRTTTYSYDAFGNVQTVTDPLDRTTGTEYDLLGRTTAIVDALGHTNRFQYDAWGSLTNLVDANGNHTGFEYDVAGRLTKKTYDDGTSHQYFYDGFGRLETAIDAKNQKITYAYDVLGQLRTNRFFTTSSSTEPEKTVVYTYDDYGRMTAYDDGVTTGSIVYADAESKQTVTVDYGSGVAMTSVYSYDRQTRQMTRINGGVTNVYSYSENGKLQSVSIPGEGDVTYQYDARGLNTEILLPGGNRRISGSDTFGLLESIQVQDTANNNVLTQSYQRDLTGSILQKQTDVGIWIYGYDRTSQLTNAFLSAGSAPLRENSYSYDPMGNRLQTSGSTNSTSLTVSTYSPNSLNQYTSISNSVLPAPSPLLYDLNGNLTNDGIRAYSWDTRNQLEKIEPLIATNGSLMAEFAYDCMGRRIQKEVYTRAADDWSLTTDHWFFYDGWNLVHEIITENSSVITNSYIWGNDLSGSLQGAGGVGGLLCTITQASGLQPQSFFPCYDHNGNVEKVISGSGAIVAEYQYDAFGNIISESIAQGLESKNFTVRFSTKYFDSEFGLYYYGYRHYSPETGRWLSRDPIRRYPTINLYAFVFNKPTRGIDFLGLTWYDPGTWPRYGNWGGKGWSGGDDGRQPPIDSSDECYKGHDLCWGACDDALAQCLKEPATCIATPETKTRLSGDCYYKHSLCKKSCNSDLVGCLRLLPDNPALWPNPPPPGMEKAARRFRDGALWYFSL